MIITACVSVLLLGAMLLFVSLHTSDSGSSVGRLLTSLNILRSITSQAPRDTRTVSVEPKEVHNTPIAQTVLIQPHRDKWWLGDLRRPGTAYRVHVPSDCIARLPFTCAWLNTRYLDNSAFCLRTDSTGTNVVTILQRSARWQMDFFEEDQLRSRDEYHLHCHVAIHTSVRVELADIERLDRLFDNLPTFLAQLRGTVAGLLRDESQLRSYRDVMYDAPALIDILNERVRSHHGLASMLDVLDVCFTALIVKPRKEAELQFNTAFQRQYLELTGERTRLEREHEAAISALESQTARRVAQVERIKDEIRRGGVEFGTAAEVVAANLSRVRAGDELKQAVQGVVPRAHIVRQLAMLSEECDALSGALGELSRMEQQVLRSQVGEEG